MFSACSLWALSTPSRNAAFTLLSATSPSMLCHAMSPEEVCCLAKSPAGVTEGSGGQGTAFHSKKKTTLKVSSLCVFPGPGLGFLLAAEERGPGEHVLGGPQMPYGTRPLQGTETCTLAIKSMYHSRCGMGGA